MSAQYSTHVRTSQSLALAKQQLLEAIEVIQTVFVLLIKVDQYSHDVDAFDGTQGEVKTVVQIICYFASVGYARSLPRVCSYLKEIEKFLNRYSSSFVDRCF